MPMRRSAVLTIAAAMVATAASFSVSGVSSAGTEYPSSMAATGDSITRAYNVSPAGAYVDNPEYSWSTGTAITSQYSLLQEADPGVPIEAYNDARTGSRMSDLDRQMRLAAKQHAGYVTVLMGANDVCTPTIQSMTPTSRFEREFRRAMTDLTSADPTVKVFVSSIPDIHRVWELFHTDPNATATWRALRTCQSMLSASNSDQQRQQVVAQEQADNAVLDSVCTTEFASWCLWDNSATYDAQFTTGDVSTVDYYHPSIAGQQALAYITWQASYWGS